MWGWLHSIDVTMAAALPEVARVGIYGLLVGAIAMLIYWKVSPQKKLVALRDEMRRAQRELKDYRGTDGKEVLRLSQRAIALASKQVLMVVGPTLVAVLPVIVIFVGLRTVFPPAASWMRSWELPFMIGLSVSALVMKFALKIV